MTHQEILGILGFQFMGGNLYHHHEFGAIQVEDSTQITQAIFDMGKRAKADEIKKALFLK